MVHDQHFSGKSLDIYFDRLALMQVHNSTINSYYKKRTCKHFYFIFLAWIPCIKKHSCEIKGMLMHIAWTQVQRILSWYTVYWAHVSLFWHPANTVHWEIFLTYMPNVHHIIQYRPSILCMLWCYTLYHRIWNHCHLMPISETHCLNLEIVNSFINSVRERPRDVNSAFKTR